MASGRGSNFDALAQATREPSYPARIVVVACDRPGAPVLEKAERAGIPVHRFDPGTPRGPWAPAGVRALMDGLAAHDVEAICLAGFMRIVPVEIVRAFAGRILNVHPALLPAFPGAHGVRDALDWGAKVTGATVHLVDEEVDHGPVVLQEPVLVLPGDDERSLHERIQEVEHRLLPQAVRLLATGRLKVEGRRVHILEDDTR